jgi:hypothetical protein
MPSRARHVALLAVASLVLALPSAATAAVQARQADAFVDSIGVNVHTAYNDTPYVSEFATVEQRLQELGIRHVRDELRDFPDRAGQYQRLNQLAADGIGLTLTVGSPEDGIDGLEALLAIAADDLEGVEALEGPNEYSTSGDPEWKPKLLAYQQALYEQAKDDPDLAPLPVIGPSIVHNDQAELGYIAPILDFGNIHSYPQGNPPDALGPFISRATLNSAEKPIWATETGYHTALNWSGEHPPVPEAAMATYMPRLFLEYFRWGIVRTFSYELLDEWPDPDLNDRESNFGLLRNDLTPKPAFDALRNTIAILEDPGPQFAPAALDYTLSEGGVAFSEPESTGLHKVLLQKRDGSFFLALWRTASVWSVASEEPVPAVPQPVQVAVEPGIESATAYLPNVSAAPAWSVSRPAGPVTVEVGPAVTLLRLVPSVPAPAIDPGPQPGRGSAADAPAPAGPSTNAGSLTAPPPCAVPKLAGRRLAAVRTRLRLAHCRLGTISGPRRSSSRVTMQRPRPGRVLPAGAPVAVRLGADA